MPIQTRYVFSVSMDVESQTEALFNEVYDTEHVPLILSVPGVVAASRFKSQPVTMIMGGQRRTIAMENEPRYHALYELARREAFESPPWLAVRHTAWSDRVRPTFRNTKRTMFRRVAG